MSQECYVCKPIDSYSDIDSFLHIPPIWRSLCKELIPHSKLVIRNEDLVEDMAKVNLESPQVFCHFDSDKEQLHRRDTSKEKLPKVLVCHDMANGYHDDCYLEGTGNADAYTFYNWAGIDIFCYFSHHLITIPPIGWINVGHEHGVQVIGTVITEWADGEEFWTEILSSEEKWQKFANSLVSIAETLKFDGWLLNIENKVSSPQQLIEFVRFLHHQLHRSLPHALLVWYDSVTEAGRLNWQNRLSDANRVFFSVCDAIFTNYSWSEQDVEASASMGSSMERLTDVFVGVDIWGRNFYGGGKFNTQAAMKVVHKYGCSVALFAPAWTHEAMTDEDPGVEYSNPEDQYQRFLMRDRALWDSLWPFFNTKLPEHLPFATSFCRGQGPKRRMYGEVVSPGPWFNLRHQQYQPNAMHGPHGYVLDSADLVTLAKPEDAIPSQDSLSSANEVGAVTDVKKPKQNIKYKMIKAFRNVFKKKGKRAVGVTLASVPEEEPCLSPYLADSFCGGSCLRLAPGATARLLLCAFLCDGPLVVCVATKARDQALQLVVEAENSGGERVLAVLDGREGPALEVSEGVAPLDPGRSPAAFRSLQEYLLLHEPGFYVPVDNAFGWKIRYYEVQALQNTLVTSLGCRLGTGSGDLLLGLLALTTRRPVNALIVQGT